MYMYVRIIWSSICMYMYVCKCTHTGCTKMHVNHGYVFIYMYVCTGIPADMCMYYMYIHICMYIH